MTIAIADLPYELDALAPHISKETLNIHYGKHHLGYVKKLNNAISGTEFSKMDLLEIVRSADGGIFNNAAQIWNHSFYWNCLGPDSNQPADSLMQALVTQFGSLDAFKQAFNQQAKSNFGSGWTWLVKDANQVLHIVNTSNADTPVTDAAITPLLTCDVWEHAYYIDYRNRRGDYLDSFWKIVNWEFVAENFVN